VFQIGFSTSTNFPGFLLIAGLFFLLGKPISGIFGKGKKQPPVGPAYRPTCRHVLRPIGCLGRHSLVTARAYKSRFRPELSKAPIAGPKPHLAALNCLCPHAAATFVFGEELTCAAVFSEASTALSEARPIRSCRVPAAASPAPSSKHRGSHAASSSPVERRLHCCLPCELGCATFLTPMRLAAHRHASTPSCQSTASRRPSAVDAVARVPRQGAAPYSAALQHQPAWLRSWQRCGRELCALCIQATPGTVQPGCTSPCASRPSRFGP
jgi:hypothetical protein